MNHQQVVSRIVKLAQLTHTHSNQQLQAKIDVDQNVVLDSIQLLVWHHVLSAQETFINHFLDRLLVMNALEMRKRKDLVQQVAMNVNLSNVPKMLVNTVVFVYQWVSLYIYWSITAISMICVRSWNSMLLSCWFLWTTL